MRCLQSKLDVNSDDTSGSWEKSALMAAMDACGISAQKFSGVQNEHEWHRIARKLVGHRLSGLSFKYLKPEDLGQFPDFLHQGRKDMAQKNMLSSLRNVAFLRSICVDFDTAELPFLLLKGEALGFELYGEFGLRHSGDIDLWVAESDLERVHRYLISKGFCLEGEYFERGVNYQRLYRKFLPHFSYKRDDGVLVEVHWRLFTTPSLMRLSFADAYQNHRRIDLEGVNVPVLGQRDNLLYLMAHASNHFYVRLFWLLDIAVYIERDPDLLSDELLMEAKRLGIERILCYSVVMLHKYLKMKRPFEYEAAITKHCGQIEELVSVSRAAYGADTILGSGERLGNATPGRLAGLEMKLSPSLRYKKEVLFRLSLNQEMFSRFPLPSFLYFLYPVVRLPYWLIDKVVGRKVSEL